MWLYSLSSFTFISLETTLVYSLPHHTQPPLYILTLYEQRCSTVKMLMLGGTGVGKTCLLSRFVDDYFTDKFVSTVGIDFRYKCYHTDALHHPPLYLDYFDGHH